MRFPSKISRAEFTLTPLSCRRWPLRLGVYHLIYSFSSSSKAGTGQALSASGYEVPSCKEQSVYSQSPNPSGGFKLRLSNSEMTGIWKQVPETSWGPGAELQSLERCLAKAKVEPSLEEPSDRRSHQKLCPHKPVLHEQHPARRPSSKPEFCGHALAVGRHEAGSPGAQW